MWGVVVVVGSSERVPGSAEDAGVHGELVNESSGKGVHTRCPGVLDTGPCSWWYEECSIYHYVPICPPVPPSPLSLVCVHALCHLINYQIKIIIKPAYIYNMVWIYGPRADSTVVLQVIPRSKRMNHQLRNLSMEMDLIHCVHWHCFSLYPAIPLTLAPRL